MRPHRRLVCGKDGAEGSGVHGGFVWVAGGSHLLGTGMRGRNAATGKLNPESILGAPAGWRYMPSVTCTKSLGSCQETWGYERKRPVITVFVGIAIRQHRRAVHGLRRSDRQPPKTEVRRLD